MDTKSTPRPQPADRLQAEESARRLSHAVASGDPAAAAQALTTLGQALGRARERTPEGVLQGAAARGANQERDAARESFDPARGLRPARNPAFAAARAVAPARRHSGAFWSRAFVGVAAACAVAWWFATHGPQLHEAKVSSATASGSAPGRALQASTTSGVRAAEAEILESQVMALAGQMRRPAMHATPVLPHPPEVAERTAAPQGGIGAATARATDFSAVRSLIARWRNEQAQLATAEQKLAAGRTAEARHLIEAVQTQIVLLPVTPDDPRPAPGDNATAAQLGRTLQLMDAGEEGLALRTLRHAIQDLGSLFPGAGGPGRDAG